MFLSNTHSFYYYQSKFLFLSKKYANNINNYSLFISIIHYIKGSSYCQWHQQTKTQGERQFYFKIYINGIECYFAIHSLENVKRVFFNFSRHRELNMLIHSAFYRTPFPVVRYVAQLAYLIRFRSRTNRPVIYPNLSACARSFFSSQIPESE